MLNAVAYFADACILLTYFLAAKTGSARSFHWANAIGCLPIIATEFLSHAWAALILTSSFGLIGAFGVVSKKGAR